MKKTKSKFPGILIASLMYVAASFINALCQAIILAASGATSVMDYLLSNTDGAAGYMVITYILSAVFHGLGGIFTVKILKRKYAGKGVLTAKYFNTVSWTVFIVWSILGGLFSSRSGWVGALFQSVAITLYSKKFIEVEMTEAGEISGVVAEAARPKEAPTEVAPEAEPEKSVMPKAEGPKAMYCRKCGKKFVEDSLFCPYCGEKSI